MLKIKSLIALLNPVRIVCEFAQGARYHTLPHVFACMQWLRKSVSEVAVPTELLMVRNCKSALIDSIDARFAPVLSPTHPSMLCAFLHPCEHNAVYSTLDLKGKSNLLDRLAGWIEVVIESASEQSDATEIHNGEADEEREMRELLGEPVRADVEASSSVAKRVLMDFYQASAYLCQREQRAVCV